MIRVLRWLSVAWLGLVCLAALAFFGHQIYLAAFDPAYRSMWPFVVVAGLTLLAFNVLLWTLFPKGGGR